MRPREWLVDADLFGKSLRAEWRKMPASLTPRESAERAAAFLQHQFAFHFETELRESNVKVKDIAGRVGIDHRHLSHVLRGRQKMPLDTLVLLVVERGDIQLFPAPASIAELTPE